MKYPITPVAKPRMTRRDKIKWAILPPRPSVAKYFAYCNDLKKLGVKIETDNLNVAFALPMPKNWSKKKREKMRYKKHQQTPDCSNLIKALEDALLDDDSHIWRIRAYKIWDETGWIEIL